MTIAVDRIATGFVEPVFVAVAPGDPTRLFVVEQHSGLIKVVDLASGATEPTPFLQVPQVAQGTEQGLLGLAFHPDYASNGRFYVNFTDALGDTVVREYQRNGANPNLADPASARTILTLDQPFTNHNGGWLGFGPDGFLYVATGDGGSGGDPGNRAQNVTDQLLGKILRLDVDGDAFPGDPNRNYAIPADNPFVGRVGDDEIWAFGLRNPWRPSFDRLTGDLYIADVGQGQREEVNFQPAGSGGRNYGWKVLEGTLPFSNVPGNPPANDPSLIAPIHEYSHTGAPNGGFSITGGYVYRGPILELQGLYFFADFVSDQIWSFRYDGTTKTEFTNRTQDFAPNAGAIANISSFGEDALGNLYIVDYEGEIFRFTPGLFTASGDTADLNQIVAARYIAGTQYDALGGDDAVSLPNLAAAAAAGFVIGTPFTAGPGNDSVTGGDGDDVILGGAGDDALVDTAGDNIMSGDAGGDTVTGGDDSEILLGEDGDDRLLGGADRDMLVGGNGADSLEGGDNDDRVVAAGNDLFASGGSGIDMLAIAGSGISSVALAETDNQNTGPEGPVLQGFEAIDATLSQHAVSVSAERTAGGTVLIGSDFNDTLTGSSGADVILGGVGADIIDAGPGGDTIFTGVGNDSVSGGDGSDQFFHPGGALGAAIRIADFMPDDDTIVLAASFGLTPTQVLASLSQVGADAVLVLPADGSITFVGLSIATLTLDDFVVA